MTSAAMRAAIAASPKAPPPESVPRPTERVAVQFRGEGRGRGPLSWGQRDIWSAMTRQGWLSLGGTRALAPDMTMPQIIDDLRAVIGRYPSMRTLLRFDDGDDPTQELFDAGTYFFDVYDTSDEKQAQTVADTVEQHYRTAVRDFAVEWPVRTGVVRCGGQPMYMVVISCHLVTDGAGADAMNRQVVEDLNAPAAGVQQLEQAAWQRSPAGQRQSAIALRYWEKLLRAAPPRTMPVSPDPREPRHWTGNLRSPALYDALPALADRARTDTSAVLLALYAVALSELIGQNPVVIWPLVNNRFRSGLSEVVCNLVQSGIALIDVSGPFDEVVARAARAALGAYKHGYYDSAQHAAMMRRVAPEHGTEAGLTCFFNDRRTDTSRTAHAAADERGELAPPPEAGTFEWVTKKDNPFERLFVAVEDVPGAPDVPGSADAVQLVVNADTHCFAPAAIERLVRSMETVAVEEAFGRRVAVL